jgi:hypothetical protein
VLALGPASCNIKIAMKNSTLLLGLGLMLATGLSHAYGADGRLTVTATVETSVGVVFGSDGEARLIIANAPDKSDNVSSLRVVMKDKDTASMAKKPGKAGTRPSSAGPRPIGGSR